MKFLTSLSLATVFCLTGMAFQQQQSSPGQSSLFQNSQDVPTQQPSTNNPDVGKQRHATPAPSTDPQQQADVPHQQPGTNNPDVGKQRHSTDKKSKKAKSTDTSSQSSTQH